MEALADLVDSVESNIEKVSTIATHIKVTDEVLVNINVAKVSIVECRKSIIEYLTNQGYSKPQKSFKCPIKTNNGEENQNTISLSNSESLLNVNKSYKDEDKLDNMGMEVKPDLTEIKTETIEYLNHNDLSIEDSKTKNERDFVKLDLDHFLENDFEESIEFENEDLDDSYELDNKEEDTETGLKDKCIVCGKPAIGFNYGALTCQTCKAFFRRNTSIEMSCRNGDKSCKPNAKGKLKCQLCRYNKCVKVGMIPELVGCNKGNKSEEVKMIKAELKLKLNKKKRVVTRRNNNCGDRPSNNVIADALMNYLNILQKTHKFTVEEVLSSLDTDKYEYFITGKEKNGKILEQCGICLRTGIPALDSHLKSHFELVPCADCGLQLFHFEYSHHRDITHYQKCRFCHKFRRNLEEHAKTCNRRKVSGLQCKTCGKPFKKLYDMRSHEILMHSANPVTGDFVCDICGRHFTREKLLQSHKYKHNSSYDCDICPEKFKKKVLLLKHKYNEHSVDQRQFCETCGENVFDLKTHIRLKHKNVDCTICGKRFQNYKILYTHNKRVHEKSTLCKCEICGKQFSTKSVLPKHMRNVHKIFTTQKNKSITQE